MLRKGCRCYAIAGALSPTPPFQLCDTRWVLRTTHDFNFRAYMPQTGGYTWPAPQATLNPAHTKTTAVQPSTVQQTPEARPAHKATGQAVRYMTHLPACSCQHLVIMVYKQTHAAKHASFWTLLQAPAFSALADYSTACVIGYRQPFAQSTCQHSAILCKAHVSTAPRCSNQPAAAHDGKLCKR